MRVPKDIKRKQENLDSDDDRIIELKNLNLENYMKVVYDPEDPKAKDAYIKKIERKIIRNSIEYKTYIRFLKDEFDMTHCTFFKNLDIGEIKSKRSLIEFHHYPLTLYDIVKIVIEEKTVRNDFNFTPFTIANEVMELHYKNQVGLVPLAETIHKMAHTGYIFIPLNLVFGNYKKILKDYKIGVDSDIHEKLEELQKMTDEMGLDYKPDVLKLKLTYLDKTDVFKEMIEIAENSIERIELIEEVSSNDNKKLENKRKTKSIANELFNEDDDID